MAVNKVDLYVSQILEDLDNGLTWLKRDDIGYGSIQEKYNAKEQQITMIRKHPKLKDAETNITVFNIIDDTDETTTLSSGRPENDRAMASVPSSNTDLSESGTGNLREDKIQNDGSPAEESREYATTSDDDLSAFVNL